MDWPTAVAKAAHDGAMAYLWRDAVTNLSMAACAVGIIVAVGATITGMYRATDRRQPK